MKLVIHTQFLENYGAHDWDGEGECPQYWKAKGGETYVVEGLDWLQITANQALAAHLCEKVSHSDEYSREFVIDWSFEEDGWKSDSEWNTPTVLSHNGSYWVEKRGHEPYGNNHLFTWVTESWLRDRDFKHIEGSYESFYTTVNGDVLTQEQAVEFRDEYEARQNIKRDEFGRMV